MENLTVSLDTAKKLKAAGFPQEPTRYQWLDKYDVPQLRVFGTRSPEEYAAAPTAQEIADNLDGPINVIRHTGSWNATDESKRVGQGENIAEALASLWLKLNEATIKGQHPQEDRK